MKYIDFFKGALVLFMFLLAITTIIMAVLFNFEIINMSDDWFRYLVLTQGAFAFGLAGAYFMIIVSASR